MVVAVAELHAYLINRDDVAGANKHHGLVLQFLLLIVLNLLITTLRFIFTSLLFVRFVLFRFRQRTGCVRRQFTLVLFRLLAVLVRQHRWLHVSVLCRLQQTSHFFELATLTLLLELLAALTQQYLVGLDVLDPRASTRLHRQTTVASLLLLAGFGLARGRKAQTLSPLATLRLLERGAVGVGAALGASQVGVFVETISVAI